MFNKIKGFFKSKKENHKYLDFESIDWIESQFRWFAQDFDESYLKKPYVSFEEVSRCVDFSNKNQLELLNNVLEFLAEKMAIPSDKFSIEIFENERIMNLDIGNGESLLINEESEDAAATIEKNKETGFYSVRIEKNCIANPQLLIGVLVHEFAHIKLMDHKDEILDEETTDLICVFYGFGVFNANISFNYAQNSREWRTSSIGYLSESDWSYALAVYYFLNDSVGHDVFENMNKQIRVETKYGIEFLENKYDNKEEFYKVNNQF